MKALLLIGPPGAGKSPFGDYLQKQSGVEKRFCHLDFGRELREIIKEHLTAGADHLPEKETEKKEQSDREGRAGPAGAGYFNRQELERVRQSVETSSLFEEADRELVRKIVRHFLEKNAVGEDDILILNGLPRHRAQLGWLEDILNIALVVNLDCPEDVAVRRILANLDGERQGREDDRLEVIVRRYRLYQEKTGPLLDYFRQSGVPLISLKVDRETRPEALWAKLQSFPPFTLLS
ncbi:MAG: nucleoside monophosphate kinase [Candidatus Saccharicenans sp.]|jgi:adenylate kinase family enzyme|nr:nucleoside monophosphate kinase [Candidatus Saccharicenans sp.]MDH7574283.1 nucleoside monophosphate kinase [Candidatus Saccharicenans sp.]